MGVDFSKYAANAFTLLQEVAARYGKDLQYNIPVELGGFSIFFPLLLSLITGFPTVDADGAGRAVEDIGRGVEDIGKGVERAVK